MRRADLHRLSRRACEELLIEVFGYDQAKAIIDTHRSTLVSLPESPLRKKAPTTVGRRLPATDPRLQPPDCQAIFYEGSRRRVDEQGAGPDHRNNRPAPDR